MLVFAFRLKGLLLLDVSVLDGSTQLLENGVFEF